MEDSHFSRKQRFEVKNVLMSDLFIARLHSLMDWSNVDYLLWIIVMFLSAVWTLILTAPIHCIGSIAEQVI